MKWFVLIFGIFSNAFASVLIKLAMSQKYDKIELFKPLTIFSNIPLLLGIFFYGIAFVTYSVALTIFPLSVAHPSLTSGSIALVAIASLLLFNENISLINWLGILLIITGVIALTVK